jgi:hypothetical protein
MSRFSIDSGGALRLDIRPKRAYDGNSIDIRLYHDFFAFFPGIKRDKEQPCDAS